MGLPKPIRVLLEAIVISAPIGVVLGLGSLSWPVRIYAGLLTFCALGPTVFVLEMTIRRRRSHTRALDAVHTIDCPDWTFCPQIEQGAEFVGAHNVFKLNGTETGELIELFVPTTGQTRSFRSKQVDLAEVSIEYVLEELQNQRFVFFSRSSRKSDQ